MSGPDLDLDELARRARVASSIDAHGAKSADVIAARVLARVREGPAPLDAFARSLLWPTAVAIPLCAACVLWFGRALPDDDAGSGVLAAYHDGADDPRAVFFTALAPDDEGT